MKDSRLATRAPRPAALRRVLSGLMWVALPLLGTGGADARAGEPGTDELVRLVIDAIERNFSVIKTAQVTVREVLEDRTVTRPEITAQKTPDGGALRVSRSPRKESQKRIVLKGDKLRFDNWQGQGGGARLIETWALVDGIWTQYVPGSSAAWIRRTAELPGMFPVDPRQVGSEDTRRWITDILREDAILSAELTSSSEGHDLIRMVARSQGGGRTSYEFRADQHFLPTRCETRWPDGSLLQLVEYEYRDVLAGQAKFLKRVTRSFFAQGATVQPKSTGWRQRLVRELTGDLVLNDPIADDAFTVRFKPGTRVSDNTRHAVYASQIPIPDGKPAWWWYAGGLMACVTVFVSLRTYRHAAR